jgi:hypothetical protein
LAIQKSNMTRDWSLYEAGKTYNNRLRPNYYQTVDANIAFVAGDQWRNLKADNMPKPVFNIIKRVLQFQVASLTSTKTKIHFEPLLNADDGTGDDTITPATFANREVENLFEKLKMDFRIKDALFDAAITGDGCAHFYWDPNTKPYGTQQPNIKGEICMELVDGTNVFFGNANTTDVDCQPYIIISGRDTIDNLKAEAKRYKQQQDPELIQEDQENYWQAGTDSLYEVSSDESGKALYIIIYRKKTIQKKSIDPQTGQENIEEVETIVVSKSVRNAYIYQDIDTGLTRYPIAWLNWEKQKNRYHGRALATGILPNQIYINRMFAMVMYHLMMTAFPKAVYNADVIPQWDNSIGSAIPVSGVDFNMNMSNLAGYLQPGNMSNQIMETLNHAMQWTKEMMGVSDPALGQVDNPTNTSAIIAVQKSSAIPLEIPKMNMYEWIEDIGRILFDFMGTYYGPRPIVVAINGQNQQIMFDFSVFKDEWLKVRVDVGESSYWSEIASLQTLDNLLMNQKIEFLDYLERVPEEYIPQKQHLIDKIQQQMQMQQQMQAEQNDPMNIISQMDPKEQQAFQSAPPQQQQQILVQFMKQMQAQQPPQPGIGQSARP